MRHKLASSIRNADFFFLRHLRKFSIGTVKDIRAMDVLNLNALNRASIRVISNHAFLKRGMDTIIV